MLSTDTAIIYNNKYIWSWVRTNNNNKGDFYSAHLWHQVVSGQQDALQISNS